MVEEQNLSDMSVSSVHTSDLSEFDDEATVHSNSVKGDEAELELSSEEDEDSDVVSEPEADAGEKTGAMVGILNFI